MGRQIGYDNVLLVVNYQTLRTTDIECWKQSYKTILVSKKFSLVLNSSTVHYLILDHNNTEV